MTNDLVHGCVQFPSEFTVGFDAQQFCVVVHKFLKYPTASSFVVGVDDVSEGNRLGAMNLSNPVAVGQVHTDWSAGGCIACLASNIDHVVRDPHHLRLLVCIHEWHVIFKPLSAVHECGHARTCIEILDFNDGLITACVPQRIVVDLNESIDVVHVSFSVLNPVDVVEAPFFQISRLVVGHEIPKCRSLLVILGILNRLVQPLDDFCDALAIQSIQAVNILHHVSFCILFQATVQSIFHWTPIALVNDRLEICLGLFRRNARRIEVDRRTLNEAF